MQIGLVESIRQDGERLRRLFGGSQPRRRGPQFCGQLGPSAADVIVALHPKFDIGEGLAALLDPGLCDSEPVGHGFPLPGRPSGGGEVPAELGLDAVDEQGLGTPGSGHFAGGGVQRTGQRVGAGQVDRIAGRGL